MLSLICEYLTRIYAILNQDFKPKILEKNKKINIIFVKNFI